MKSFIKHFGESPRVSELIDEVSAAFGAIVSLFLSMFVFFGVLMRFDIPHSVSTEVGMCIFIIIFCLLVSTALCLLFYRKDWKRLSVLCGLANATLAISAAIDGVWGVIFFLFSFLCFCLFGRIRNGNGNLVFLLSYIFALFALGLVMHFAK